MNTSLALPRITICTPSFNQGHFIEETINSVLNQSYPNLEYIVMDGGSTDGTVDILRKYEKHLVWKSEKDRGQSDAINKGFRMASGDILAFINSDDVYEPGALHKVGKFFAGHPQASWLTGQCRIVGPQGREFRKLITYYKNFWLLFKSYNVLLVLDYISQPATFWRRDIVKRIGSFDEGLHLTMDYDYSLRVGKQYKLWIINDYLASFRVHDASKSAFIHDHFNEDLSIAQRYTRSYLQIRLHRLHNQLIISSYLLLQKRSNTPVSDK
jgi:glycosyltransferase involved in cell wall biosynthesis